MYYSNMISKSQVKHYLNNDKRWIDLIWFFTFLIPAVILPWFLPQSGADSGLLTNPIHMTALSVTGVILAMITAYLLLRKHKLRQLFAIFSNIVGGMVLWINGAYATGLFSMVILPLMNITIAWYWKTHTNKSRVETQKMTLKNGILIAGALATFFAVLGISLVFMPGGDPTSYVSWMDSMMTTMVMGGLILVALRYRESFYVFFLSDLTFMIYAILQLAGVGVDGEIPMYMIPQLILYVGWVFNSILGMYKWK